MLAMTLLSSSVLAGFIQSPIPPSSHENYLLDLDGDGRLDHVDLKFLGALSPEYVEQMVDSLTLDWPDPDGVSKHFVINPKLVSLDSNYNRRARLDLSSFQEKFELITAATTLKGDVGSLKMFLHDGTVFDISVKDRMEPVIKDSFLRSYRGKSPDTLKLEFSETVTAVQSCEALLESRSKRDSLSHFWTPSEVIWNDEKTSALLIFDGTDKTKDYLLPRDSIRLTSKCFADSPRNLSSDQAVFKEVAGFYPIEVLNHNMVYGENTNDDLPIFQMLFEEQNADVPNDKNWGVAMDVLGPEFENAVRDAIGMDQKAELDLSKLKVFYNVRIYTNLGSFVVGTSDEIYGDDSRFNGKPARLFLKWNLMDGTRKRVATGAYISNTVVMVSYDGKIVFRNDVHHGPTTQVFGVKR